MIRVVEGDAKDIASIMPIMSDAFDPRFENDMQFSNILQAQPSPEPDPEPRWMPMKEYSSVSPHLSATDK